MTTELVRYDAACRALAECRAVDEVKSWADKAAAMQAYGRMAKDKTLEIDAAEIRLRAERRLGELIAAQKATVGLNTGTAGAGDANVGRGTGGSFEEPPVDTRPTLADAGIDKKLSARAQKLAAVPAEQFETEVAQWRDRVEAEGARVTARLESAGERAMAGKPKKAGPVADTAALEARIAELTEKLDELASNNAELIADNESMAKVFEADDKLAAAADEIKKLNAQARVLRDRVNGLMNEKNEAVRIAKALQRKLAQLEKAAA